MNVKQHFSDLKNALEGRNTKITEVLEGYRKEAARITARYSDTVAAEKLAQLEADARASIQRHDTEAHDTAEKTVGALRGALMEHITGTADPGLLAQLQMVQSFNLPLTRSEVEAMAKKSNGNPVTLAALAQVADKSGFQVEYTTPEMLERDLQSIMSMFAVPSHFTPDDLFHEGLICHPNRMYQGVDYGRPDSISLSARMVGHTKAPGQLDEMDERWSDPVKVEVLTA